MALGHAQLAGIDEQLAALDASLAELLARPLPGDTMSDLNIYVHLVPDPTLAAMTAKLDALADVLSTVLNKENQQMATLDETLASARAASTKVDSLIALQIAQKKQLDEVLAGVTLTPAQQEKVDAIFAVDTSDAEKMQAALDANVPPV